MSRRFDSYVDHFVRPEIRLLQRSLPSFRLCGYLGLALAVIQALILCVHLGLSVPVIAALTIGAVLTFLGLVLATRLIAGVELIIYYHHEIAVMAVSAFLLRLLRQPVLPYLDVVLLSIGVFLACGRVGCLMAGCCHGRPSRWGVRYRQEHADAGFTHYYVGVRLFPVQVLESVYVAGVVAVGVAFVLNGYPPGTALAWYVIAYGVGRFCFEFGRGDPERPYLWGFSQPQWISLVLMCGVVGAEAGGVLPFQLWHAAAAACLSLAMIAVRLRRHLQTTRRYQLLHPRHVHAIAHAIQLVPRLVTADPPDGQWTVLPRRVPTAADIHVGYTFLGVKISTSKIERPGGCIDHYALSWDGNMTEQTARVLARLIGQLKPMVGRTEILKGNQDVFHVLVHHAAGEAV